MKYVYFVSFIGGDRRNDAYSHTYGNVKVTMDGPVDKYEHIAQIEDELKKDRDFTECVVQNYILISTEE